MIFLEYSNDKVIVSIINLLIGLLCIIFMIVSFIQKKYSFLNNWRIICLACSSIISPAFVFTMYNTHYGYMLESQNRIILIDRIALLLCTYFCYSEIHNQKTRGRKTGNTGDGSQNTGDG